MAHIHALNEMMEGHYKDVPTSVYAEGIAYHSKQVFIVQTPDVITNNETQQRHPKYILSTGGTTLLVSFVLRDAGIISQIKQNE